MTALDQFLLVGDYHYISDARKEVAELRADVSRLRKALTEERIAVGEFLRMTPRACGVLISINSSQDIARLADAIEHGEHRKPYDRAG